MLMYSRIGNMWQAFDAYGTYCCGRHPAVYDVHRPNMAPAEVANRDA